MLGSNYTVFNFGRSSHTMIKNGIRNKEEMVKFNVPAASSYWDTE